MTIEQPPKGLIIGGGIAGTVAALALQQAGISALVCESRASAADTEGAFLTLAVNGIESLAELGIDARSLGGFDTPRFRMLLGDGTSLAEMPSGPTRADGTVSQTIRRADLYRGLREVAERRGIVIRYGKRLAEVSQGPDVVSVRFEDGTTECGSFLVAADGLHSRVRRLLDPEGPAPRYLGLLNAGGFARGLELPGPVGTMHFVFGKRCFLGWVKHPDGSVWWFANPGEPREPTREEVAAIDWRGRLVELFSEDDSPGVALVEHTDEIATGWITYDLPKVRRWHDGHMLLVGDAAHAASPSSGQGASMAIEDGVVLGRCFRDAKSPAQAFAEYERIRRKRVERVVAQGKRNGTGKTPGPLGRVIRDAVLRLVFARQRTLRDPMAWLYDERPTWGLQDAASHPR